MSTFKETTEREFHIINFIDKSLVTFTPVTSSTSKLLVKGASVKDSNNKPVYIGLTDGITFKYLTDDNYNIYYQSSDAIYINKSSGIQGWPIYLNVYKENIGVIAPVKYSYNGVSNYFFSINYIPYEVLFMTIVCMNDLRRVYLFNEELPSSYSADPDKHIALYSGVSGDLSLYTGGIIYYDPMNILGRNDKSINDYVSEGIITYKSGNDFSDNIKSKYILKVSSVNIPNTNKETQEITEKTKIYCYEYLDYWQTYGGCSFMTPNGKSEPLVYKSVAHY